MSSGTSDTVYSAIANLDAHDKSIPPDRSKENIAAGLLSILTDGGHTYETLVKGCLVLLLCRTPSSKVTGESGCFLNLDLKTSNPSKTCLIFL